MKRALALGVALVAFACGDSSTGINVTQVLGIPPGDKEGTALSGDFAVSIEYTSNGCKDFPALEVPQKGIKESVTVTVEQDAGAIVFRDVLQPLFGGIYFDNHFEVGGTEAVDRDGSKNVLRAILLEGDFQNPDEFTGKARARMVGRIDAKDVDCSFTFTVSGIRS